MARAGILATEPRREDVGAAALVLAAFLGVAAVAGIVAPASPSQVVEADPLVRAVGGLWPTIAISALVVVGALRLARPDRGALRRAAVLALAGAILAAAIVGVLALAFGRTLPAFIPPEESSRPGLANGLAAGTVEEAIFRIAFLFPAYVWLSRRMSKVAAAVVASIASGVLFALSHELAGDPFALRYFVTRVVVPGAGMSLLFFRPGPAFIVGAHSTAHLFIPVAFD
jgi:hypothetical protein